MDTITTYNIYVASPSASGTNYTLLQGDIPLETVHDQFWKMNRPLEVFYANSNTHISQTHVHQFYPQLQTVKVKETE